MIQPLSTNRNFIFKKVLPLETVSYGLYDSKVGKLVLFFTSSTLCGIHIFSLSLEEHINIFKNYIKKEKIIKDQENCTIWGNLLFSEKDIVISLSGTSFQELVWKSLLQIPHGKTASYKEIASYIGRPKAFRATANAIGKNPLNVLLPCHRVINSSGEIGGFRWGISHKRALLSKETSL